MELAKPADQNVYIGVQRCDDMGYEALPFFAGGEDERRRYDVEHHARDAATPLVMALSTCPSCTAWMRDSTTVQVSQR